MVLAGAAPDTSNLGVSALARAATLGLTEGGAISVAILGHGGSDVAGGWSDHVETVGAYKTRRLWRPESYARIGLEAALGLSMSGSLKAMRAAVAFLDLSGGDSFTDLYGHWRFEAIVAPKRLAQRLGKPLVLLPQTYGPFEDASRRREASQLTQYAEFAFARDARSFDVLQGLLGEAYDPHCHRLGVDVAFLLPRVAPAEREMFDRWFEAPGGTAGLNVSGLIYNDPGASRERFGFHADYRRVIRQLIDSLLQEGSARVALIPHVMTPKGHYESDAGANEAVLEDFAAADRERILLVPPTLNECEVKWVISRCDWFCGTRMHSTIAALSSGVPTAAIAYSPKTLGVFETCGQGAHVADPRQQSTEEVVEQLMSSWTAREEARESLRRSLPAVMDTARDQMRMIRDFVISRAGGVAAELERAT